MSVDILKFLLVAAIFLSGSGRNLVAGDILRGGASTGSGRQAADARANAGAAAAELVRTKAADRLARTTQVINAMRQMQVSANAAGAVSVPDGLVTGGLERLAGGVWTGANAPVQAGNLVTIKQTGQQALLNWKTFNVGRGTTVNFDQSAGGSDSGTWVAFNKISDPSGKPSQILGSIKADGQIYLINGNGIIFGAGSQVNTHALVASALPINDGLIARGLLNNPDAQFLFSSTALASGSKGPTPAFTPAATFRADGSFGDIVVENGAVLTAPTTPEHVGGRITLVGANVVNGGTLSTPDGQTILAAGLQVGFAAHAGSDPSLRGLDVYVGKVSYAAGGIQPPAGTATNSGLIDAPRADVTIIGKSVRQLGAIDSSTSTSLNGRVDLLADYGATTNTNFDATNTANGPIFFIKSSGTVELGSGSVTRILPELTSAEKVPGTQLALPSQIKIEGQAAHFAAGSTILAPDANVTVNAGNWIAFGTRNFLGYTGGQVYLDQGAIIDVSGSVDISAPLAENILTLQLRGAELANSPLQRTGTVRGTSITVDLRRTGTYNGLSWIGTPLGDVSGYAALIKRTVGELTAAGGTVSLNAGESVVMQKGSTIDVSGGWINYAGGIVQTTRLLSGGVLYDIAQATPDRVYSGIYTGTSTSTDAKYGITKTFNEPLAPTGAHFEPGYLQGANAGTVSITAPSMALDGTLLGQAVQGPRQSNPTTVALANPGSLNLTFQAQQLQAPSFPLYSPTPPNIVFQSENPLPPAGAFAVGSDGKPLDLNAARKTDLVLSPALLTTDGFGSLKIDNSDGAITVPENTPLTAPLRGSITFSAAKITIGSTITAPGGALAFNVFDYSPFSLLTLKATVGAATPAVDLTRGVFILGPSASLNAAGLLTDNRSGATGPAGLPPLIDGGSVAINAFTADLAAGSAINVSGGFAISPAGTRSYGAGGNITINAGRDPNIASLLGGKLSLGSTLEGYSGGKGGSLTVQAPLIQIGGAGSGSDEILYLAGQFFSQGGFTSFALNGLGKAAGTGQFLPAITIAPDTIIEPVAVSWLAVPGNWGSPVLKPFTKPEGLRSPVSLAFGTAGTKDDFTGFTILRGDFFMGAGAVIQTDPTASVSIKGDTVAILGSIIAPGGSIMIGGANSFPTTDPAGQTLPLPTVDLGPRSVLSAAGRVLLTPDPYGRRVGSVLAGGTITVSGNIVAEAGALLDVSGASGILDLSPATLSQNIQGSSGKSLVPVNSGVNAPLFSLETVPTRVDSNAGAITLKGGQELFADATLIGFAGGPSAKGGSLAVSSGHFVSSTSSAPQTPLDINLVVTQSGPTLPTGFAPTGGSAIGYLVPVPGDPTVEQGHFAVNSFLKGGFDVLTLGGGGSGAVQFSGPVSISARRSISVGDGGVIFSDSAVALEAPYVVLGVPFPSPSQATQASAFPAGGFSPPTYGPGSLMVRASLIDIGSLSLQDIGNATFIADGGDIRGDGTLDVAGKITLRAGQIYPVTASQFTIAAYDYSAGGVTQPGSVTIIGSGTRQLPLSVGGELNIYGALIVQGGTLRAPLGTINLGWDGTGTSPADNLSGAGINAGSTVATTRQLTLTGGSVTSVSAVDPLTGQGLILPYGFNLNGTSWIDPTGIDITAGGLPSKAVNLSAVNLTTQSGSLIDVRGGGDLYAYRWVTGNLGTRDILASTSSFAVIPGYQADYSPYASFNNRTDSTNLAASDPGYVNSNLSVGDKVYLGASSALPAGTYTLLPARYALLPGAVLVTPQTGTARTTVLQPDGASIVSGYRFNDLNGPQLAPAQATRFEIDSATVVQARARYDGFLASSFLKQSAQALGTTVPRLPVDSGSVVLSGMNSLQLQGAITGQSTAGGRGALVDISTTANILIVGTGGSRPAGTVVLDAAKLDSFGAESLLIGGTRQTAAAGMTVIVNSGNLEINNAGTPLAGPEIILVAKTSLTLDPAAEITQSGSTQNGSLPLLIGDASTSGSGNGLLLRVSDTQVPVVRSGVSSLATQAGLANPPVMLIGPGAKISGTALTLDSTYGTTLDPAATLAGSNLAFNSGQISLQFATPGSVPTIAGLTLSGPALQGLQSAQSLSLLSYSSIDLYGNGSFSAAGALAFHAGEIRGFNNGGNPVTFTAADILLDNSAGGTGPGSSAAPGGRLVFDTGTIRLGAGQVGLDQFAAVDFKTTGGLLAAGSGNLAAQGVLTITAPLVAAAQAVNYAITATGALDLLAPAGAATVAGGLGATLSLAGASLTENSNIALPSGTLSLRAKAGDLIVGNLGPAHFEVGGTAQSFNDLTKYTDGGQIALAADNGSVTLGAQSRLDVSAQPGGGNAGSVSISAPNGIFTLSGTLAGNGGTGSAAGAFSLDAGSIPGGSVTGLDATLNAGGFNSSRNYRVRTGSIFVGGLATSRTYSLSTDAGSITVNGSGVIDASGATGGNISLVAYSSVTLQAGARLSVAGQDFSSAGKGGAISLEAGSERNGAVNAAGFVDVQTGSTIDLSVASVTGATPADTAANTGAAALLGDFTGTLHLRAPQVGTTDLQVDPINGTILNASNILVEGYKLFDLTGGTGTITAAVQTNVKNNGTAFGGNIGAVGTAGSITDRLLANNASLASVLVIAPGAEIINRTGNLTLGTSNSTASSDWDLSTYRFGPNGAPGVLTLRAAGNLVFYNALSDGFTSSANTALLLAPNPLLPVNAQSWSYRLTSGADFSAADFGRVQALSSLAANSGSLLLGKLVTSNNGNPIASGGVNALTSAAISGRYQVIRTGSGDITVSAGRDVQLLNEFATIYTAGTAVADPTLGGAFVVPPSISIGTQGTLGVVQQNPTYAAQYSLAGGNVLINAQQNIEHLTQNNSGQLVADSQKQIPDNWLYRRGYVDPLTGEFGVTAKGDIGSTSWWVDFSNFFEGVGALGGGNVSLIAGNDVSNVDAVAPTNGRVTYKTPAGDLLAADQSLVELGGGDVAVRAGHNIDAGVYYVENGRGTLSAGNSIVTNSTRSASLGTLATPASINPSPAQWLPTTLFLGKGSFDVSAAGDVLLGPVVNPFLLPGGVNNAFWRKSYFSTYAATDAVNVTSLGGSVTLRESATMPGANTATSILQNWMNAVHLLASNPQSLSYYQPWLRLDETSVTPFSTVFTLLPGTLRATAFSGDINLVGTLNLSPSPSGTIELAAAGAINGLQVTGVTTQAATGNTPLKIWGSATVNLSDANPASIPGVNSPYAYQVRVGNTASNAQRTAQNFLSFIEQMFAETGSSTGSAAVIQTQQALHGSSLLHANDPDPILLYAGDGNISGLTLFSAKSALVVAGGDITDIAFYIQITSSSDISVVSARGDIIPYDANSLLRVATQASGNLLGYGQTALAGDIQISGPGTLEVLAGHNLDLGTGTNNADGTGVGITSIGNARNPNLPFAGADIIAAAGLGEALAGLAGSDFTGFLEKNLAPGVAGSTGYLAELQDIFGSKLKLAASTIKTLPDKVQAEIALQLFYLVLRDTGRNHNLAGSPGFGSYAAGFAAIQALFPNSSSSGGDINTRSRDIRTKSGGNISLLAPGGGLTLATSTIGSPLAPPGIITEDGGNISIFTNSSVDIGISRIFTLRGGNEIIWSSTGDIAAGSSAKTVQSAPPTRVLIDPQSANLKLDLAGLATGGGIGVLATVGGVPPGSVDLIAPAGTVDAGDAGIRATGNLNIAAVKVLNAGNIQAGGTTAGVPTAPVVAAPNIGGLTSGASASAAANSAAQSVAIQPRPSPESTPDQPSTITVEVLGYGGGEDDG